MNKRQRKKLMRPTREQRWLAQRLPLIQLCLDKTISPREKKRLVYVEEQLDRFCPRIRPEHYAHVKRMEKAARLLKSVTTQIEDEMNALETQNPSF